MINTSIKNRNVKVNLQNESVYKIIHARSQQVKIPEDLERVEYYKNVKIMFLLQKVLTNYY